MFFSEVEGHMQKLSSFGRGKKFGLKSHLGSSTQPLLVVLVQLDGCDMIGELYFWSLVCRLMLQDSTEEQSSKRGRYEYRDGSGPSSGQPPPSYSAQRVSLSPSKTVTMSVYEFAIQMNPFKSNYSDFTYLITLL